MEYRAPTPKRTHATNSGSGLGLSIAQKIVQMHEGTTFIVSLPVE